MKPLRHFFSRALDACKPGRGKAGNSLALVMMVGAALVIWVMCIMPLMATTGATAAKTEQNYDDYLDSRSSIEYCKSELQDIVTREMPYTFAVIREIDPTSGDITYKAIKKMIGPATNLEYQRCVENTLDPLDDTKDEPTDDEEGDKVAAICAVGPESGGVYDITITTFHNGEKGQSYSLSFTVSGSLLIFPESYKQNDALPLSDFAVVDGKMGANQVWDSTIEMGKAVDPSTGGSGNFTETLLPWKLAPDAGYADTGEYPAAFKKTANAAPADASAIGEPLTDGEFTNENWIVPTAVSGSGNKPGEIWWDYESGNIAVYLYKSDQNTRFNITNDCTIYLNGKKSDDKAVPKQEGYYCITVDYNGTGAYDPSENAVNILPASGLRMPDVINAVPDYKTQKQEAPKESDYTISPVKNGDKITVELVPKEGVVTDGVLYAYCGESKDNSTVQVTWSETPKFADLDANTTWYFYACRAAKIIEEKDDNGNLIRRVFKEDSEPTCLGAVCPAEYATSLESGTPYAIVGESNGQSYVMDANQGADPLNIGDGYIIAGPDGLNIPAWTATASESQWYLQNNGNYLTMTGTYEQILFWGSWTLTLSTASEDDGNGLFTVGFGGSDGTDAKVSRPFRSGRHSTTGYLSLSTNSGFTATDASSYVKFLKVPNVGSAPSVTSPSDYQLADTEMKDGKFVLKYEKESKNYVSTHISPDAVPVHLYANGKEFDTLDAGVYYITAELDVGTEENPIYRYADLGMLTILKSTENGAPDLKINQSAEDDLTVTISTGAPAYGSDNNRNMLHFGYKADGEQDFHWYPADEQNRTFRLMPGKYQFAVCRFGDSTYEAVTTSGEYEITFRYEELTEENKVEFLYTFDKDSGTVVWYKLPARILPCRVQLVFGSRIGDTSINWSTTYTEGTTTYYGVIVESSNRSDLDTVLQVPPPVGITNLNGRTTSMMRGSSLYFMGRDSSINTYGNSVYLTADLVVLNKGIDQTSAYEEKGHVYVEPHSTGGDAPGDVLLFTVNDITCNGVAFKARTFYRVPKDTDLCNPTGVTELGDVQTKEVKDLFRLGVYPEINLDIAYASDEQLAHVVSSETIGWTNGGVLSGQDNNNTNAGFVVCAYVSDINGSVSYKANRVLIATGDDSSHTLNVPANLTFTTRYLSIDADYVIRENSGVKFTIHNLGQDSSFIQSISNALGLTGYSSKTLQVDFERTTKIIDSDGNGSEVKRQICRYDDSDDGGADLFSATSQSLMVTYTTSEIERLFINWLGSTVKTVDRYITLKDDGDGSLDIGALFKCELDIYANYIYVDSSVKEINIISLSSDLKISSQESGYTRDEYLGLFKGSSAESYTGTLLYFKDSVRVYTNWKPKTISPGFYYIKADSETGETSLSVLANNPGDYVVTKEQLENLSVYIDSNGNISNAYVDTGIWDNTNTGLGGFSGGNVG